MTDDDVKLELKSCPFCGGASSRRSTDEAGNKWVVCDDCGGRAYEMDWNRRPNSSSPDGRREGLVEALTAVRLSAWKHVGDDAFSQGMDHGAVHQIEQSIAAIRRLLPKEYEEPVAGQGPPSNGGTPNSTDGRMREAAIEECAKMADEHAVTYRKGNVRRVP